MSEVINGLTYWYLDKMVAIFLQTSFSNLYRVNETLCIFIQIALQFVPEGPVDNKYNHCLDNGLASKMRQAII